MFEENNEEKNDCCCGFVVIGFDIPCVLIFDNVDISDENNAGFLISGFIFVGFNNCIGCAGVAAVVIGGVDGDENKE